MKLPRGRVLLVTLLFSTFLAVCGQAVAETGDVQTAWRLLDYIAVDYGGAVEHGRIVSESEYAEQVEFAATVATKITALPSKPGQEALQASVKRLQQAIADKVEPDRVAEIAHGLAAELLQVYPVPLAPDHVPDLARGAALYQQQCASCHGASGDGRGPAAAALPVPPIAFTELERARQRSPFALYQVITQGLDGTPMASFGTLPTDDRWALAFYAGQFAFNDHQVEQGEQLWASDPSLHRRFPDLKALAGLTPAALEAQMAPDQADAVIAYLRRHPEVLAPQPSTAGTLLLVRERLAGSLAAYRAGDRRHAGELALSAYLDGFEPVEPVLGTRDAALLAKIEGAMGEYRAAIQHGEGVDALADKAKALDGLFDEAEATLAPDRASRLSTFVGAATILLREGLEALLIVVAMLAFLRKAERLEVVPYVHAGWVGALLAGALTWGVATWLIEISGASRELTEGFGSVFAAIVLLSVGIWMHGKAQAGQWQRYIREKMAKALSGRSAWLLGALAFIVVYREVFETILFYAALWTQGNGGAMLAGAACAVVALALIAWAMLRYSRTLPIGKFFTYSAWLMAVLTVVLAGKGIAALQEAGVVGITPIAALPRIALLGVFPTSQTVMAQALALAALIAGFAYNRRRSA
jgi:high-affinity iron transporter